MIAFTICLRCIPCITRWLLHGWLRGKSGQSRLYGKIKVGSRCATPATQKPIYHMCLTCTTRAFGPGKRWSPRTSTLSDRQINHPHTQPCSLCVVLCGPKLRNSKTTRAKPNKESKLFSHRIPKALARLYTYSIVCLLRAQQPRTKAKQRRCRPSLLHSPYQIVS